MATDYPGAVDGTSKLPNPSTTSTTNSPSHAGLHANANDAIKAVETKLGTGSSTPASSTLLIGTGAGTSAWSALTSSQLASVLSDETGTGSAVFATTPTLITPKVDTINEATSSNGVTVGGVNFKSGIITGAFAAGTITFAQLLSTIFSGQVTTTTNAGTGLGSLNRVNLGGIKILWGTTTAQSLVNNGNLSLGITFGVTFTTAPTLVSMPYAPPDNRVSAVTTATTTTTGTILLQSNNSATNNVAAMWFAVGV